MSNSYIFNIDNIYLKNQYNNEWKSRVLLILVDTDEGIRRDTTLDKLSKLKTLTKTKDSIITPGSSSQITDGASAVIICNDNGLKKFNVKPNSVIRSISAK